MSGLIPSVGLVAILNTMIDLSGGIVLPITLKLYSNDYIPVAGSVSSSFTEVSGGGYVDVDLESASFTVTGGSPASAQYNDFVDFTFTGSTDSPGTVYGYYILDANSVVIAAERFPSDDLPFSPVNGSLIRVKPSFTLASS